MCSAVNALLRGVCERGTTFIEEKDIMHSEGSATSSFSWVNARRKKLHKETRGFSWRRYQSEGKVSKEALPRREPFLWREGTSTFPHRVIFVAVWKCRLARLHQCELSSYCHSLHVKGTSLAASTAESGSHVPVE